MKVYYIQTQYFSVNENEQKLRLLPIKGQGFHFYKGSYV